MEFLWSSGASTTCRELSFFPSVGSGTTIADGESLPVSFTAVCTNGTPPADVHEIMNVILATRVGSDTVLTSMGVVHL